VSDIRYDPVTFSYWIGETKLKSVSSLIKSVTPTFDKERVSLYCAKKEGISQAEILRQWEIKGEESRRKGTEVHTYVDKFLSGKSDPVLDAMNVRIPEMNAFDSAWKSMQNALGAKVSGRELTIGNESLGIAGRLDVLLDTFLGGQERKSVIDWKTGKLSMDNRFAKLIPPFDDCDDSDLAKYSLQLSAYRLILEENGTACADSYLVHLKSDGTYFIHKAIDYRDRLSAWLKSRKD